MIAPAFGSLAREVAQVVDVQRRFADHEHQWPALLQADVGGALRAGHR